MAQAKLHGWRILIPLYVRTIFDQRKPPSLMWIWIVGFVYTILIGGIIQIVLLPFFLTALATPEGLLKATDSVAYHNMALAMAADMHSNEWPSWEMISVGDNSFFVSFITVFYTLFTPQPWVILPINAGVHALCLTILYHIACRFLPDWRLALLCASPYLLFPSSAIWYSQLLRDGFFNAGMLLFVLGWVNFSCTRIWTDAVPKVLIWTSFIFGGLLLMFLVRHSMSMVLVILCWPLAIVATGFALAHFRENPARLSQAILILVCLASILAGSALIRQVFVQIKGNPEAQYDEARNVGWNYFHKGQLIEARIAAVAILFATEKALKRGTDLITLDEAQGLDKALGELDHVRVKGSPRIIWKKIEDVKKVMHHLPEALNDTELRRLEAAINHWDGAMQQKFLDYGRTGQLPIVDQKTGDLRALTVERLVKATMDATKLVNMEKLESLSNSDTARLLRQQNIIKGDSALDQMPNQKPNRLNLYIAPNMWEKSGWLPEEVDKKLATVAGRRHYYLGALNQSKNPKSTIDTDVTFNRASDILSYLPRALQIALLAPFPDMWLGQGSTGATTMMRRVSMLEMSATYLALLFLPFSIWLWRTRGELWIVLSTGVSISLLQALTTPNIGTLYRIRYGYIMLLVTMGMAGAFALRAWCREKGR